MTHQGSREHQGTNGLPLSGQPSGTNAAGEEALLRDVIEVPRDKDAKRLVEAILDEAHPDRDALVATWGLSITTTILVSKLGIIQGNAERLAVLLDERDAAREELVTAAKALADAAWDDWPEVMRVRTALARVNGAS